MKEYYFLVVSVIDKNGNREEAYEITGSCNKEKLLSERTELENEIRSGEYDKYIFSPDHTLSADIEVHDDETNELLWIE